MQIQQRSPRRRVVSGGVVLEVDYFLRVVGDL